MPPDNPESNPSPVSQTVGMPTDIYPDPSKKEPAGVAIQDSLVEPLESPINYRHIFIFGSLTTIATAIALGIMMSLGFAAILMIAIIFRGYVTALIIVTFLVATASGGLLRKYVHHHAHAIAYLSIFGLGAIAAALESVIPSSFIYMLSGEEMSTFQKIISNPLVYLLLAIGLGGLLFVASTFMLHGSSRRKLLVIPYLLVAAGLIGFGLTHENKTEKNLLFRTVGDSEWAVAPTFTPSGVTDGLGDGTCKKESIQATYYDCKYYFKNYPGYLSDESKREIDEARAAYEAKFKKPQDSYFEPVPWLYLTGIKKDPRLDKYKFKDGQCDLLSLKLVAGKSSNNEEDPPRMQKCASVKTPEGKTLYYDSFLNYAKNDPLPVPVRYYFEQDNTVVVLDLENGPAYAEKDTYGSLYLSDSNFQSELFKFVDSFQPVR